MFQKSHIDALRAVIVYNLYLLDLAEWSDDKELAAKAKDIVGCPPHYQSLCL